MILYHVCTFDQTSITFSLKLKNKIIAVPKRSDNAPVGFPGFEFYKLSYSELTCIQIIPIYKKVYIHVFQNINYYFYLNTKAYVYIYIYIQTYIHSIISPILYYVRI